MEGLRRPTVSSFLRDLALDEAVIRERHDPGLETMLLVRQQQRILSQGETSRDGMVLEQRETGL
jgi:hypothetical protein